MYLGRAVRSTQFNHLRMIGIHVHVYLTQSTLCMHIHIVHCIVCNLYKEMVLGLINSTDPGYR